MKMKITYRAATLLALVGVLIAVGCRQTDKGANGSADDADSGHADSVQFDDFNIEIPPAYAGDFNLDGMEVGVAVGKLAPEIEGEDLDGIPFKLSDYRGKVVMLDFWGDW